MAFLVKSETGYRLQMIENDKIILSETKLENLSEIIEIEKSNIRFIGQYSISKHKEALASEDERHISIFNKPNNFLVGYVILAGFSNPNHSIEFRRTAISKKGLGYGKNAIRLIKKISFEHYKAHQLWLDVFTNNSRAINLYEKEGFKKERKLKDTIKQNEEYRSIWIMSILKNEYKTL